MGNKNKNLLKKYSQANKVQLHQRSQEYYRNLSEVEKIKKKYADIRNKIFLLKEYKKKNYYERKKLLNHLINCVEELENVFLNSYIFNYHEFYEFLKV